MDSKKYFEEYLQTLYEELININENLKLWLYVHNFDNGLIINRAPNFFNRILSALFESVIISLTRLFDSYKKIDRSDRNIIRFINFIESNINVFPLDTSQQNNKKSKDKLVGDFIKNHRELINTLNPILDNLFVLRYKYINHFDSKYFNNVSQLLKDYEIKVTDIEKIIKSAEKILDDYSMLYNRSKTDINAIGPMDIDNI